MISILVAPQSGTLGRILVRHTAEVAHIESQIGRMGFRAAKPDEIQFEDAKNTAHILVAIGEKVPHPDTNKPSYKGFCRRNGPIHVYSDGGTLQPNVEVAVFAA